MSFLAERKKTGMSQMEVAKQIGVSDASVSMWETGITSPRAALLPRIATLYGCTVDELLKQDDGRKN